VDPNKGIKLEQDYKNHNMFSVKAYAYASIGISSALIVGLLFLSGWALYKLRTQPHV
jgi:hypothetical protein